MPSTAEEGPATTGDPGLPPAEEAPADGPEEIDEAAQGSGGFPPEPSREDDLPMASPVGEAMEESLPPLPGLPELMARVPAAVGQQLDERFRARFYAVRRVPPSALKG